MQMVPVASSNLGEVGYEGGNLYVRFRSGGLYVYSGVPPATHAALMGAASKGSYLHRFVKPFHPCRRVG